MDLNVKFRLEEFEDECVITIPEDNLIIVRLGHHIGSGFVNSFSTDFYTYIDEAYKMIN